MPRPTHCAQGAIFRRNFCIAMTFGLPTSSSVAHACRLSEDRVVMSKSMRRRRPTPLEIRRQQWVTYTQSS